ncbi:hypothetical protein LCGC14_0750930 [marine sediment metagenome]|uniref:Uncharacterized protein n=1 Tax=marine sediment metagenome TaxID=412755 RepID=A0A0F9Q411_9ZZZZ
MKKKVQRSKLNFNVSYWGSLIRHPNAVYQMNVGVKTQNIRGIFVDESLNNLRKYLYDNIISLRKYNLKIYQTNFEAREKFYQEENKEPSKILDVGEDYDLFDSEIDSDDLEEFYRDFEGSQNDIKENFSSEEALLKNFDVSLINLIKIDETSEINSKIFPKSYICTKCDYFIIFNDEYRGDLFCPNCKKEKFSIKMQQYNYLFTCPVCANIEPIAPFWEYDLNGNLIDTQNLPFKCLDPNCKGSLNLFRNEKNTANSFWYCSKCKLGYRRFIKAKSREHRVYNFHNKCKIFLDGGDPLPIKYDFKRNSARNLNPLIFEYLSIENKEISYESLKEAFEKIEEGNRWELNRLEPYYKKLFESLYNIEDVFIVHNLKNQTCCLGYESSSKDEKLLQFKKKIFFETFNSQYNVFFFENIGNGLVIKLNTKELVNNLKKIVEISEDTNYTTLIEDFIDRLNNEDIQDLLKSDSPEVGLFKAIHFFSHVILEEVKNKIGLDVFRTKILLRDGVILIYEVEKVMSGGLIQLTLNEKSRNIFFSLFCFDIINKIKDCNNDCSDYCQKCSFINDFFCRPLIYYENVRNKWLPPNSLLSRDLAGKIIIRD